MIDEKLLKYIKDSLSAGSSIDGIKQGLLDQGWSNNEIDEAAQFAKENSSSVSEAKKGGFPKWLIAVLAVIVIGVGIFGYLALGNQEEPQEGDLSEASVPEVEPVDCEADFGCFITASKTCKPAMVTYAVIKDIASGVGQTVSAFFEIKGEENSQCVLYGETKEIGFTFPEDVDVPQEVMDNMNESYIEFQGENKTQKFEMEDLTALLERLKSQDFPIFSLKYFFSNERIAGTTIDCGTDFDCLIVASQFCEPATVDHTTVIGFAGVRHENVVLLRIDGEENGKCVFYEQQKENNLTFPPETPQEIVDEQQAIYDALEGMDGTCKFDKAEDFTSLAKNWKIGNMSTEDLSIAECSGELFINLNQPIELKPR